MKPKKAAPNARGDAAGAANLSSNCRPGSKGSMPQASYRSLKVRRCAPRNELLLSEL